MIRQRLTDNATHGADYYDPQGYEINPTPGTSHLVAADRNGLVISMTTTVNLFWDSRIMVPETGVVLNGEMDDFSSVSRIYYTSLGRLC
jgi:gamma-glutamyltranspeptidase / glutathione hydrolase